MAGDWMATASAQAAGRVSSSRASTSISSSRGGGAAASFVSRRRTVTMMPVGVPRVPYRLPKGGAWVWIDIWNCLVRIFDFFSFVSERERESRQRERERVEREGE